MITIPETRELLGHGQGEDWIGNWISNPRHSARQYKLLFIIYPVGDLDSPSSYNVGADKSAKCWGRGVFQ